MKYYLYQHIREDTKAIFYIGIGTKTKQDIKYNTYHRAYMRHSENSIWANIVNKTKWNFEIIFESDSRVEVENKEIAFITNLGRICDGTGNLANFTLGGESNLGYSHSEDSKQRISIALKGKSNANLGKKHSEETRKKRSESQRKISNSVERKATFISKIIGNTYNLGKRHSEESKEKMSKSHKGIKSNNSIKCKLIDKINNKSWEADCLKELYTLVPISAAMVCRLSTNKNVSKKIKSQYELLKF